MAEYIELEAAVNALAKIINESDMPEDWNKGMSAAMSALFRIPAADVRPVVFCRDCVYWQKPQVKLNDGTYRDYEQGEYDNGSLFGGVTADVGINIGSFCAKYNTEHQNRIPQFMGENDFCSKGYKLREENNE